MFTDAARHKQEDQPFNLRFLGQSYDRANHEEEISPICFCETSGKDIIQMLKTDWRLKNRTMYEHFVTGIGSRSTWITNPL